MGLLTYLLVRDDLRDISKSIRSSKSCGLDEEIHIDCNVSIPDDSSEYSKVFCVSRTINGSFCKIYIHVNGVHETR